jgi:hypothetical protein
MVSFNAHLPAILASQRLNRNRLSANGVNDPRRVSKNRAPPIGWQGCLHPEKHQLANLGMKFLYRSVIGLRWITASFRKPRSHILNRGTLPSPNLRGLSVFVNKYLPVIDARRTFSITPPLSFLRGSLQAQPWP